MENTPHISSTLESEKIKILKNINLNSLFNLTYNFEVLKLLIENLLANQQKLQNQINEMHRKNCQKDKYINQLLDDVKTIKESYINKDTFNPVLDEINEVKENLKQHEDKFNEGKIYILFNLFTINFSSKES